MRRIVQDKDPEAWASTALQQAYADHKIRSAGVMVNQLNVMRVLKLVS